MATFELVCIVFDLLICTLAGSLVWSNPGVGTTWGLLCCCFPAGILSLHLFYEEGCDRLWAQVCVRFQLLNCNFVKTVLTPYLPFPYQVTSTSFGSWWFLWFLGASLDSWWFLWVLVVPWFGGGFGCCCLVVGCWSGPLTLLEWLCLRGLSSLLVWYPGWSHLSPEETIDPVGVVC